MKYVFVDMDGVIAEYGYPNGYYDGDFQRGNYLGKMPVMPIINEIINRYGGTTDYAIMVCSSVPNAKASIEKSEWLNVYFNVPYENRIYISPDEDKVEVIRYYVEDIRHMNVQGNTIIIDDKGSILAKAKSLGIECYHPTQILTKTQTITEQSVEQKIPDDTDEIIETNIEDTLPESFEVVEEEIEDPVSQEIEGQMSIDDLETENREE